MEDFSLTEPHDFHVMGLPSLSVMVTMVLLYVALMWAISYGGFSGAFQQPWRRKDGGSVNKS